MPSSGASRTEESDADKLHGRGGQNISQELPSSLTGYFSIVPSEKDQKRINIWIKTLSAGDQADVLIVPGQTPLDPPSLRPRRQEPLTSPNTWGLRSSSNPRLENVSQKLIFELPLVSTLSWRLEKTCFIDSRVPKECFHYKSVILWVWCGREWDRILSLEYYVTGCAMGILNLFCCNNTPLL